MQKLPEEVAMEPIQALVCGLLAIGYAALSAEHLALAKRFKGYQYFLHVLLTISLASMATCYGTECFLNMGRGVPQETNRPMSATLQYAHNFAGDAAIPPSAGNLS
jgi:hypothetical protein